MGVVRAQDELGADISLIAQSGDIEINGEVTAGSWRNATALAGSGMVIVTEPAGDGERARPAASQSIGHRPPNTMSGGHNSPVRSRA